MEQINNILPTIANRKEIKTNRLSAIEVDQLVSECRALITPAYEKWFIKRFYSLSKENILKCASEARADYKTTPQQLFTHLIKKEYDKT